MRHCVRIQTVCYVAVEISDNSHTRYLRTNYFKSHCEQITSLTSCAHNETKSGSSTIDFPVIIKFLIQIFMIILQRGIRMVVK